MFGSRLDRDSTYKLDESNVYGSVLALPEQIKHARQIAKNLSLPDTYKTINRVVIAGMGGSALGGWVIKGFGSDLLPFPLEIVSDYVLPSWANGHTLVILSSYSGNTEEVLEVAGAVKNARSRPVVITTGGKLADIARRHNWPALIFEAKHNPSDQPRMALGYNVGLILSVLETAGLIKLPVDEFDLVDQTLVTHANKLNRGVDQKRNSAKELANSLIGKAAVLIAARHLRGAAHTFKNQLNENAKTFSAQFDLPELDHHLLEGLGRPKDLSQHLHFVLFDSPLYSEQISKRLKLTEEVINKQGYGTTMIRAESPRALAQAFETIQFGSFVSLYLAMANKINPAPIPWVDYFKKKLA